MNLTQSTLQEVATMLKSGMVQLTEQQMIDQVESIGYKFDLTLMSCYTNSLNRHPYRARSMYIVDPTSGHSFCNIHADRTNLKELQKIRCNEFVFDGRRIWEI